MNIAVFGCTKYTKHLIESIKNDFKIKYLITISPELGDRCEVAGYRDLSEYAAENDITIYSANRYNLKNLEDIENISKMNLDIAFVQGWQRLIPPRVLDVVSVGIFGMHGSFLDLPYGKGRSPLNWSIIENDSCFYTNLFKYDPGVDSGDILGTFKFDIGEKDTAQTLHFKNSMAMVYLIKKYKDDLLSGKLKFKSQHGEGTFYKKRSPSDSLIDWTNDVYSLDRHIRAVTRPFNGAFTYSEGRKITIYSSQVFGLLDYGTSEEEPGTVVSVFDDNNFLVKCLAGLLLVTDYTSDFKVEMGMKFDNYNSKINYFKINKYGRFDVKD